MRWSKLKARIESRFAASVSGRVELRDTWYRTTGQMGGRGWISVDGEEIHSFSDAKWWREVYLRNRDIEQSWEDAEAALKATGLFSRNSFYEALYFYLNASLEDAMDSQDPIVRGLAMLDRKLGKRRLRALQPGI